MTTINTSSDIGTELVVLPSDQFYAHTYIAGSGHYPTPRILEALNAVPMDKHEAHIAELRAEVGAAIDNGRNDRIKAEAERDFRREENRELAATIERVREAVGRHPEPCTETEFSCGWKHAVADIRDALDPKPFKLPTEAGVRFEAHTRELDKERVVFITLAGASEPFYMTAEYQDTDHVWKGDDVMRYFTDHRLLGAE